MDMSGTILGEWGQRALPTMIERELDLTSYARLRPPKIIVLTGFRRTGKTYLTLLLARSLLRTMTREQVVYLNFEDERIPRRTQFLTGLLPAIRQYSTQDVEYLLLDEIQDMPDWSRWLRRVYDAGAVRLVVTGSSSKMSSREIPTELRGRFLQVNLFPLSFPEFLKFRGLAFELNQVESLPDEKARMLRALCEYVRLGGLPEIVLAVESRKTELAHSYYQTVVRRDIIERHRIRNEEGLKALMRLLLDSTHYTVSKLHNTLKSLHYDLGKATLQRFIGAIENTYFLFSLPAFYPSIKNQMQHPRKAYLIDNIFISSLSSRFSRNQGRLYENLVAIELLRRYAQNPEVDLHYWKNVQHEEVDFVVRQNTQVSQLIQVCADLSDPDTRKREFRALVKASRELKCTNLLVLTEDYEATERFKDRGIRCLPLWKWLLSS